MTADILLAPPTLKQTLGEPKDDTPYWLTTPDGQRQRHTRMSTIVEQLDSKERLHAHQLRELAYGIGLHDDLWQLANSHKDYRGADRPVYEQIVRDAQARAAGNGRANIGTGLHKYIEEVNRGTSPDLLTPKVRAHAHAYRNTINRYPITINTNWMEQVVILDEHGVAGRLDNVAGIDEDLTVTLNTGRTAYLPAGSNVVADLKTGHWMSGMKWSAQVAGYAGHTATWVEDDSHPHKGTRGPKIDLVRTVGLLIHLDAEVPDDGPPQCHLYWLDLDKGWDLFTLAYERHLYTKEEKRLMTRWVDHDPTVFDTACETWARQRLAALPPAAADALRRQWPLRDPDTGQLAKYEHPTPEQTRALLATLDTIETAYQLPLTAPPVRPGDPQTQEPHATQGEPQ